MRPPIHFALIVPGWNCARLARRCWRSILGQRPGHFTWEAHLFDDGSDDGTWDVLRSLDPDPRLHCYRGQDNRGAAYARHFLIRGVEGADTVCALLDLDDQLEPHALQRVSAEYLANPDTWLTYGSWRADRVHGYAQAAHQGPYPREIIEARSYRDHSFRAAPLRTFRRHLADAVEPRHLAGADGDWVRCCTDVALMWALLEQCSAPKRIRYISEPIYRYTWRRETGTVMRYGTVHKQAVREHLRTIPQLPPKWA